MQTYTVNRVSQLGRTFSSKFDSNCEKLESSLAKDEVELFRALQDSLQACSGVHGALVEEYHGTRHLVEFVPHFSRAGARSPARCELADLLVIAYDMHSNSARMTFLQAKSERKVSAGARSFIGKNLASNIEQWDLLAHRPLVIGRGIPQSILNSAIYPSIGSFVYFLHGPTKGPEIYYSAAILLPRPTKARPSARYGSLIAQAPKGVSFRHNHTGPASTSCACCECQSTYGNDDFGTALFALQIGEWIILNRQRASVQLAVWMAAQLRAVALRRESSVERVTLAVRLAELLDPDGEPAESIAFGARSMMILATGVAPEKQPG